MVIGCSNNTTFRVGKGELKNSEISEFVYIDVAVIHRVAFCTGRCSEIDTVLLSSELGCRCS